jgi:hypothetical protein
MRILPPGSQPHRGAEADGERQLQKLTSADLGWKRRAEFCVRWRRAEHVDEHRTPASLTVDL